MQRTITLIGSLPGLSSWTRSCTRDVRHRSGSELWAQAAVRATDEVRPRERLAKYPPPLCRYVAGRLATVAPAAGRRSLGEALLAPRWEAQLRRAALAGEGRRVVAPVNPCRDIELDSLNRRRHAPEHVTAMLQFDLLARPSEVLKIDSSWVFSVTSDGRTSRERQRA